MKTALFAILFFTITSAARAQTFTISGTMHHTNLEGGCWYLATADGKQYELFGDTAFIYPLHLEGLTTRLSVEHMKGTASICMIGDIVKVVERLDMKRQALDPDMYETTLEGTVHRSKSGTWYVLTGNDLSHGQSRWEFEKAPAEKYQHVGARFREKVTLMHEPKATRGKRAGLIMASKPATKKQGALRKIDNHDPR